MASIDHDQERTRLSQVYANLNEEELRAIATDGASLTGDGVQALRGELSRRGLDVVVSTSAPSKKRTAQTEFTTLHGIVMLGICLNHRSCFHISRPDPSAVVFRLSPNETFVVTLGPRTGSPSNWKAYVLQRNGATTNYGVRT